MKEIVGNFWEVAPEYDILTVTTNGVVKSNGRLVMGAGIAKEFRDMFVDIDLTFGKFVLKYGNIPCITKWGEQYLMSFPTKDNWKDYSKIELIEKSADLIKTTVDKMEDEVNCCLTVLMTRAGCGNGGLTWSVVREILAPYFDDRFTVINKE